MTSILQRRIEKSAKNGNFLSLPYKYSRSEKIGLFTNVNYTVSHDYDINSSTPISTLVP